MTWLPAQLVVDLHSLWPRTAHAGPRHCLYPLLSAVNKVQLLPRSFSSVYFTLQPCHQRPIPAFLRVAARYKAAAYCAFNGTNASGTLWHTRTHPCSGPLRPGFCSGVAAFASHQQTHQVSISKMERQDMRTDAWPSLYAEVHDADGSSFIGV